MNIQHPDLKPPTGGPTKDEILAISLHKLGLQKGDIFADLGCGTGKVSITASGLVKEVYAVDLRIEAADWTRSEINRLNITNISVFHMNSLEFLQKRDHLDTVFIGGSKGLDLIIRRLKELKVRSIVINAVMLETVETAVRTLREVEMFKEVICAQISVSKPIQNGIMFKPHDPVFIITGGERGC